MYSKEGMEKLKDKKYNWWKQPDSTYWEIRFRAALGLLLLFANITPLLAQMDSTSFQPQTFVGLQYGRSWNEVRFAPPIAQDDLVGQRIAAIVRYTGEKHLGVQFELAYDERGWKEEIDSLTSNYTREINYIDLAIFTHISIGGKAIRPLVLLGSYLSFPLSATETIPADWNATRLPYYGQPLSQRLQYGLAGGVGVEWVLGKTSVQLDGRYRSALGGVFKTGEAISVFTFSNETAFTAQFTISYRLF